MTADSKPTAPSPLSEYRGRYDTRIRCPWCGSHNNEVTSPFGGTVSEMTLKCLDCKNGFGWMKWEKRLPE